MSREVEIPEEDFLRASYYQFIGRLLSDVPDEETLQATADLTGDDTPFGRALTATAKVARATSLENLADEYQELFIGIGRGELLPYGSYYIAGFLNEKPLAKLRGDMAKLGVDRADGVVETEDHIGSLFEIMAGLIRGDFGAPATLVTQKQFFDDHIGSWADRFFEDLEAADSAVFYQAVGQLGAEFLKIETTAFSMAPVN